MTLQSLDNSLFHFINSSLSNPVLDKLMSFASSNPFYVPCLAAVLIALAWKGGTRGRLCALFVVLGVALGDGIICKLVKHAVGRQRPFLQLEGVRLLVGRSESGSMPSSHAANSFAMLMAFYVYYRRSLWITLPLALVVGFSRIYDGVHFPSDVLAGAVLGAGYTAGGIWTLDELWKWLGREFFPIWWRRLPSLIQPDPPPVVSDPPENAETAAALGTHWLRLGWLLTTVLLLVQLGYLAAGKIDLSEDEAYQWLWSKHLALSYYSKPPLIAFTQWLGTRLWGDTEFGVRFFSPVIAAALGLLTLNFFAARNQARTGFWMILILATTPLLAVGSILMTIDPLLVLFWTAGMLSGWRALRPESGLKDWLWVGFWMGLGFLSKYSVLFQLVSWALIFAFCRPARIHLRRRGPYTALLLATLCATPVLIWNAQHNWITVEHVASDGRFGQTWQPSLRFFWDFIIAEAALVNPFFVVLLVLAALGWARSERSLLERFLFWMGAPVFVFYLLFTLHSRVLPNWVAPCLIPFFWLGGLRWESLRAAWPRTSGRLLGAGLALGLVAVVIMHDTRLFQKAFQRSIPARVDPLKRVLGWKEFGAALQTKLDVFKTRGDQVYLIGDHYGVTGLMSFYTPEAKAAVSGRPLAYFLAKDHPENQFYFWPNYLKERPGQNALFVQSLDSPGLVDGWFWAWLKNGDQPGLNRPLEPNAPALPPELARQFRRVEDLGRLTVFHEGRPLHYFRLYFCEGAKPRE